MGNIEISMKESLGICSVYREAGGMYECLQMGY
jgi:hypothetical protein